MHYRSVVLVIAALLVLPGVALSYDHGKPGLWQVTTQMNFSGGIPQVSAEKLALARQMGMQIPDVSPEQLAMIKQMGISVPGTGPMTSQICVTPAQAALTAPPELDLQQGCLVRNVKHSGRSYTADLACSGDMQGSGHVSVTYDNDEHYSGSIQFAGKNADGGPTETRTDFSGRWQAADCGAVRPFGQP
ncbi:MAG: DUF3617 domain-containing protein [Nevskia sp.]|nr:DUF3617 domain-containing protein [Nevskia sp.]